jgi:protocatechuate 3,4-dioxygenase beta subunit
LAASEDPALHCAKEGRVFKPGQIAGDGVSMHMTRRARALTLTIAASLAPAFAFQQTTGTINGHVLDAVTRTPIAGAIVSASIAGVVNATGTTDRTGWFVMPDAPVGIVALAARKTNYAGGGYRQRSIRDSSEPLTIEAGATVSGVDLLLWKDAVVTGTVVDDRGEPLTGVQVFGIGVNDVEPRFNQSDVAITDDRGVYRLSGLRPGRYVIALPSASRRGAIETGVPTVFYPFASSITGATVLTLGSGETRERIDLRARATAGVQLSGTLTGLDQRGAQGGGANSTPQVTLHLVPADAIDTPADCDMLRVVAARDGHFAFAHVPPGRYLIRAVDVPTNGFDQQIWTGMNATVIRSPQGRSSRQAPPQITLWAEQTVAVAARDVTDVGVPLYAGARIAGRITYEGSADAAGVFAPRVIIRPTDGRDFGASIPLTSADADGAFRTVGLPAGPYALVPMTDALGALVPAITIGGRRLEGDPIVLGATDVTDVAITITARLASLSGVVRDATGAAIDDASVYVFSTDRRAWTRPSWSLPQRVHEARTGAKGAYRSAELADGEYFVAAVRKGQPDVWRDPSFLESLAKTAMTIKLSGGEQRTIDLTAQPVK